MKMLSKIVGLMVILVGMPLLSNAQPQLSVGSATGQAGSQTSLPVSLSGGAENYAGMNAQIVLPAGVSLISLSPGELLSKGFVLHMDPVSQTVIVYSGQDVIGASSGVLLYLNLQIDSGAAPGTYPVSFADSNPNPLVNSKHAVSNADGSISVNHSAANGSIVIGSGPATVPKVATSAVSSATATSAISGGHVTSDGAAAVTAKGVCWSTTTNPTIAGSHTVHLGGIGNFVSSLTGLTAGTPYYVRAYATNSVGTAYGNEVSFTTTLGLPTVSTAAVSSITQTTATSGGNVTLDGGAAVTAKGVCWSTTPNPTTADRKTNDGTGTGSFSSSLTGLTAGTPYYVRAYATNSVGTAYGNEVSFTTTIAIPTVSTAAVSEITQSTATSGGNVTSDGGADVTARGVCWSTSANPTISDPHTTDEAGEGSFTSHITGLTPGTLYYVRAYATNSQGTSYGEGVFFKTEHVADISIEKRVNPPDAMVGDQVVFSIRVTNRGPCDAEGVRILDVLTTGFQYLSDDSGGLYDSKTGIWTVGDLSATAPNNTASLTITCNVVAAGESVNIASVLNAPVRDPYLSNQSSAVLLNGGAQADLSVTKTVDNKTPVTGETVTFTIVATNNGMNDATGVTVTDLLPEGLAYHSSAATQGTYAPATGMWTVGGLKFGYSAALELTATVGSEDELVNTARVVSADQRDPDVTNNASSVVINPDTVEHPVLVDLAVQKTVNLSEVDVEEEVVFTIVVRNTGPDSAESVEIADLLPSGVTFVRSTPSQGEYDSQTGIWQAGTIPAGAYAVMDIAAVVETGQKVTNTASIRSAVGFDMDMANDSASVSVTGEAKFGPDVKANGSDGPVVLSHGNAVSITISLNPGQYAGFKADWWIAVHTPFAPPGNWYTYVHPTGWKPGVNLCAQTALFDVAPFEVLNMALPVGAYTFYFAVDPPDGKATAELVDSVAVEVTP